VKKNWKNLESTVGIRSDQDVITESERTLVYARWLVDRCKTA
jgi:hypothetical protein